MAQDKRRVIASWSFPEFRAQFGKVKRASYVNKTTGETFSKLVFARPNGTYCFVGFAQTMTEPSSDELKTMKDSLRVVQLEVDEATIAQRKEQGLQEETYKICNKGAFEEWEDVDI